MDIDPFSAIRCNHFFTTYYLSSDFLWCHLPPENFYCQYYHICFISLMPSVFLVLFKKLSLLEYYIDILLNLLQDLFVLPLHL